MLNDSILRTLIRPRFPFWGTSQILRFFGRHWDDTTLTPWCPLDRNLTLGATVVDTLCESCLPHTDGITRGAVELAAQRCVAKIIRDFWSTHLSGIGVRDRPGSYLKRASGDAKENSFLYRVLLKQSKDSAHSLSQLHFKELSWVLANTICAPCTE